MVVKEENMKWEMRSYYDARYGKSLRLVRSSQPVHVSSLASTNVSSTAGGTSTSLCSTVFSATEEGYLVNYGMSHTSTVAEMWFEVGNSTVVPQKVRVDALTQCQVATIDAPFYRVDASETITGRTDTAGTICMWATLIKFPLVQDIEPDSFA